MSSESDHPAAWRPHSSAPLSSSITASRALRALQDESLEVLHDRLIEMGWNPTDLAVDTSAGCVHAAINGRSWLLYSRQWTDALIRERFTATLAALPPGLKAHALSLAHVGALASVSLDALAGHAGDEGDECIAVSIGLMKLRLWGLTVARALGVNSFDAPRPIDSDTGNSPPQSWWRSSLLVAAYDALGCTVDPARMAAIAAWDAKRDNPGSAEQGMSVALERFVILHEIGHYECGHGGVCRAYASKSGPPRDVCHRLEAEADRFAVDHLRAMCSDGEAAASTVCLLFLLLALSPELLSRYPFCDDADTYPHPLTRLIWLLRRLFPGDVAKQASYVRFVITSLIAATEESSFDLDGMEDAILFAVMGKPNAPESSRPNEAEPR